MRQRLTYANVTATLALVFAVSGTAIAAGPLITKSSQIKNGVITNADIKKGSLSASRLMKTTRSVLAGQRGPAGPAGTTGATGATGAAGPAGPAGLARAYGLIRSNGTVDPDRTSRGIVSARVDGSYMCVKLDPSIDAAHAVVLVGLYNLGGFDFSATGHMAWSAPMADSTGCTGGNEVRVANGTYGPNNGSSVGASSFFILVA